MRILRTTLITLLSCLLTPVLASNAPQDSVIIYNESRPLIYEDAWDLWPYVFLNENGEPDGYNIDLLKMIFKELNIPYIIKLKPTLEAQADLKNRRSDLMLRMDANFSRNNASYGQSIVQLFTHSVVKPKNQNVTIQNGPDMAGHTIIVHEGSFSHHLIMDHAWTNNVIGYDDMQEAIQKVSAEDDGIIVWNTMSLKWLMRKYQTNNLEIAPIDLPYGEYKFFANDHHLLAKLDSVYADLRANDKLTPIQNKWFYPEQKDSGIPSWIWNLIMIMAAIAFCTVAYVIIYKVREKKMTEEVRKSNERLGLILKTSHISLWTYDVDTQVFCMMNQQGKPDKTYTSLEFSHLYSPTDFKTLIEALKQLIENKTESITLDIRANANDDSTEEHEYLATLSVLRRNKRNRPTIIICSENDITEARLRQTKIKDTRLRYQSIFETAMVNTILYDANGIITNLNDRACENFGVKREEIIRQHISMAEITGVEDIITDDFELFHATHIITKDEHNKLMGRIAQDKNVYYEMQIRPIYHEGKRIGFFGSGREVTEVARSYRQIQENTSRIEKMNDEITDYVRNIDYVLSVGGISTARYNPDTHTLTIYSEVNKEKYVLTQTRAIAFVSEEYKKLARRLLNKMDNRQPGIIHEDLKTSIRRKDIPLHMQVHFIPTYQNGRITEYFGMFRDISQIKDIEARLELETIHAQEVEVVKNAFLHNMSHEIRTPLNSVVGFSELFEMEHTPEDETIFIREIKQSSAALLKLINDILFLSRLDAGMITITPRPTDFAAVFGSRCESAWAAYKHPGVSYQVKSPYNKLVLDIDEPNVAIIIDKIVTNAAQHTTSGTVLARYEYMGDQLAVSVEDTGDGIPEESIDHIFERFVTGANTGVGLGLSICHELIEYMGGKIQLRSTEGKGTTVWFTLPCKVLEMERN